MPANADPLVRLDQALADRGLARSRTAAARMVAAGSVTVNEAQALKPSAKVSATDVLQVREGPGYVSRAAAKLERALQVFAVDATGRVALDLGASTGGFTQVLLEHGARQVVALDVGHDQLDPLLRADTRVTVIEGENARALTEMRLAQVIATARGEHPALVPKEITLVVGDLSFISLRLILPAIAASVPQAREVILLVKPQFEVGRTQVRGGLVTDPTVAADAVIDVLRTAVDEGFECCGFAPSPILGTHGNREYLLYLRPRIHSSDCIQNSDAAAWEDRARNLIESPSRREDARG